MNELEYINTGVPQEEPQRQYYFMKKGRELAAQLSRQAGRRLTFCVTTFGCQVNTVHEIEKAA